MNEPELKAALRDIPLSGLRVFERIGSTNDAAVRWASEGAGDLSLVVADEQTAGRGRSGRRWFTAAGTALAFSLVLRHTQNEAAHAARLAGLGALAVSDACTRLGLRPAIKWPNDVLLDGRKAGGILVETAWMGQTLEASVLGVGINVLIGSVPSANQLDFPATSIESELGYTISRNDLLRDVLTSFVQWRAQLPADESIAAWEERLAFRGERVQVVRPHQAALTGILVGLEADGSARLSVGDNMIALRTGEIQLRPTHD